MTESEKLYIANESLKDKPGYQIAKQMGKHPATIYRVLSDEKIKEKIDYCRRLLADECYEKSIDNIKYAVNAYQDKKSKKDLQLKDHGFKASVRIAESIGVLPSHSLAPVVANVMIQNNTYVSPVIQDILKDKVITVDPEIEDDHKM